MVISHGRNCMMIDDRVNAAVNFRKAVESYYDFVFELEHPGEQLIYDVKKFQNILDTDKECKSMDELFWFIVSNYIHPDDLEAVDIFRKIDMRRRISNQQNFIQTEFRIKVKGEYIWVSCTFIIMINEEMTEAYILCLIKNIHEKKTLELECTQLARRDAMTRLYNKTYVQHMIVDELEKIVHGNSAAVLIVDIDNFKNVNDMFGHFIGDKVIVEFANRILEATREDDIVGRIGGDEFIVYLKNVSSRDVLIHKIQRIISNLEFQFVEQGVNTHICCSIGAVLCSSGSAVDYAEVYQKADRSLYLAKNNGKHTYRICD